MNKVSIQNLLRNYSLETTVQQARRIERFGELVASGTRIYIPVTPGTQLEDTLGLAVRLREEKMVPVPHIVARRFNNLSSLDDFLDRLAGEAGVKQVLVVAGDTPAPAGEVHSALQILESGVLEKYGIKTIGVAGHPEGHRDLVDAILRDALRRKNAYAERTGASLYIVTQFTFSADPIIEWERTHGGDIGRLPVTVGLPGLASVRTLLKYAIDCGVGASLQAFSKRYASLTKLVTVAVPDRTIAALARYKASAPTAAIAGVHFFPFGGFKKTAEWANNIVAGNFEITEDGGLRIR